MEREAQGKGDARVAGVAGLIGVRSDRYFYVGKVDWEKMNGVTAAPWAQVLQETGGFLALREAYEIVVQHRPLPDGRLQVAIADLPIFPNEYATAVVVRADMVVDLSQDEGLAKIHSKMTGRPGLLIPGGARLVP